MIEAYIKTEYRVPSLNLIIHIQEKHPSLDKIMEKYNLFTWAFLTAWNPQSEQKQIETNKKANQDLERRIRNCSYVYWYAEGVAFDGNWREESFLILGIEKDVAIELARKFDQRAFIFGKFRGEAQLCEVRPAGN